MKQSRTLRKLRKLRKLGLRQTDQQKSTTKELQFLYCSCYLSIPNTYSPSSIQQLILRLPPFLIESTLLKDLFNFLTFLKICFVFKKRHPLVNLIKPIIIARSEIGPYQVLAIN